MPNGKEATGAYGRIVNPAGVWLQHFNKQAENDLGRITLVAQLAFRQRKLTKKVFMHMAEM